MEQINTLVLKDPSVYPSEEVLQDVLGASFSVYQEFLNLCQTHNLNLEWRYYNDGKAWLAKITFKKKTMIWMSAWTGFLKATIYVQKKYCDQLYHLNLTEDRIQFIQNTKNVGKSKPCMFDLKSSEILKELETVLMYKMTLK